MTKEIGVTNKSGVWLIFSASFSAKQVGMVLIGVMLIFATWFCAKPWWDWFSQHDVVKISPILICAVWVWANNSNFLAITILVHFRHFLPSKAPIFVITVGGLFTSELSDLGVAVWILHILAIPSFHYFDFRSRNHSLGKSGSQWVGVGHMSLRNSVVGLTCASWCCAKSPTLICATSCCANFKIFPPKVFSSIFVTFCHLKY